MRVVVAERDDREDEVVRLVQRVKDLVARDGDGRGIAPEPLGLDEPERTGGKNPAFYVVAELLKLAVCRLETSRRSVAITIARARAADA